MAKQFGGFNKVSLRRAKRSTFSLQHERRLSTRMGRLTPIFMSEAIPNDTFHCNSEVMMRLAPLLAPIMHEVNVYVHFFFIPMRLLWSEWELFITGGRLGTEVPPVPPNALYTLFGGQALSLMDKSSLADYLGHPNLTDVQCNGYGTRNVDLAPFAAYYKVWYDWYRDRNYVADNTILPLPSGTLGIGATLTALTQIKTRKWEHDYFTSALPWVQRGNPVLMPITGTGNVTYLPISKILDSTGANAANDTVAGRSAAVGSAGDLVVGKTAIIGTGTVGRIENIASVNLTTSSVTINDFRRAEKLQEWMERNALGGSRLNETIMAHFGRQTSDARLQRAEYLGGGKVKVQINEVVTTAYSEDAGAQTIPPGQMAGHGISFGKSNRIHYNCEEWGFVIGIMSVMPTSGYMQGLPNYFRRRNTFLDYPWPTFANLGEQPVYNNEIFVDTTSINGARANDPVFGYQSRYSDWKFMNSSAHGDFRSSLDFWHLTRKFATQPVLGDTFGNFEDALQNRVFAVSNVDTLWCYIYNDVSVKRALPYFGTPML